MNKGLKLRVAQDLMCVKFILPRTFPLQSSLCSAVRMADMDEFAAVSEHRRLSHGVGLPVEAGSGLSGAAGGELATAPCERCAHDIVSGDAVVAATLVSRTFHAKCFTCVKVRQGRNLLNLWAPLIFVPWWKETAPSSTQRPRCALQMEKKGPFPGSRC